MLRALPRGRAELKALVSLVATIGDLGWSQSARSGAPVDIRGEPLPWFTFNATMWLDARLPGDATVFEYGAGHSSLWFAARTRSVVSVENDEAWAIRLRSILPDNATVLVRRCDGDTIEAADDDSYVAAIAEGDTSYDIVVVDGLARVACINRAPQHLSEEGIIILDNADRPQYAKALATMADAGFTRVDFVGPVPGAGRLGTTSVFSRHLAKWLPADTPLPYLGY